VNVSGRYGYLRELAKRKEVIKFEGIIDEALTERIEKNIVPDNGARPMLSIKE